MGKYAAESMGPAHRKGKKMLEAIGKALIAAAPGRYVGGEEIKHYRVEGCGRSGAFFIYANESCLSSLRHNENGRANGGYVGKKISSRLGKKYRRMQNIVRGWLC